MSSSAVQPLLALLSYPVGGNPAQYIIERSFVHDDLDWRYLTFEVGDNDLAAAVAGLRALGFRRAHCAEPHKQTIIPLLDRATETAAAVGAVNFIYREKNALVGDNLEGRGLVEALRRAADPAGKKIVMLGAGRLARAAAMELASAGAAELTIVNRTHARAEEAAALLAGKFSNPVSTVAWEGDFPVPPETDILINAASPRRGEDEARLSLSPETIRPELIVVDASIGSKTWLPGMAAERGCKTIDGLSVFIEQIAMGLQFWTNVEPDRQVLREAAEEFLCL